VRPANSDNPCGTTIFLEVMYIDFLTPDMGYFDQMTFTSMSNLYSIIF
jgi:hypothetical protein